VYRFMKSLCNDKICKSIRGIVTLESWYTLPRIKYTRHKERKKYMAVYYHLKYSVRSTESQSRPGGYSADGDSSSGVHERRHDSPGALSSWWVNTIMGVNDGFIEIGG